MDKAMRRRVLRRIDIFCGRFNAGLTAVAIVLAALFLVSMTVRSLSTSAAPYASAAAGEPRECAMRLE
jgi:hypothetical protein